MSRLTDCPRHDLNSVDGAVKHQIKQKHFCQRHSGVLIKMLRYKMRTFKVNPCYTEQLDCIKRIWYLSLMRAAKVQAILRICAVSSEPPLLAHTNSESRGTFRQKARSLAPLNGWACAVKICHDVMLEDTNSLDVPQLLSLLKLRNRAVWCLYLLF